MAIPLLLFLFLLLGRRSSKKPNKKGTVISNQIGMKFNLRLNKHRLAAMTFARRALLHRPPAASRAHVFSSLICSERTTGVHAVRSAITATAAELLDRI